MQPFSLMVQGTTSDAGKSTLVAALCRLLARRQVKVAPFKPQNMALNSAVTEAGGEIGRAQAVQAQAAGVVPHTDMNPVLIKPSSDTGAQIIIQGKAKLNMSAADFHQFKPQAMQAVKESFSRLTNGYTAVIIEGAGSPAEINLREGDIANMGFAEAVDCPVILIADIDKGGVFAHIIGTLELLSASEQNRIIGFVINRFRGDIRLLQSGLDWLEARTGKPVLAVVPYLHNFYLEAEDAIDARQPDKASSKLNILVPVLPHTSNHTDFDALRFHPSVNLQFIPADQTPPACDCIILPGSKSVVSDLNYLKQHGWQHHLNKHLRYGGKVMGVCGGYQMLGESISDPLNIESESFSGQDNTELTYGFKLLPVHTQFYAEKSLRRVTGILRLPVPPLSLNTELREGFNLKPAIEQSLSVAVEKTAEISGYEIHNGITQPINSTNSALPSEVNVSRSPIELHGPLPSSTSSQDGYLNSDNNVLGTYLHGCFDSPEALNLLLAWMGLDNIDIPLLDITALREQEIDRLADTLEGDSGFKVDELVESCIAFYQSRSSMVEVQ